MVKAQEREEVVVEIEADSELVKALAAAGKGPVTIVSNGERFTVSRGEDAPVDDDSAEFEEALQAVVGTLTPEEAERFKQYVYRGREEGSRPFDRP